MEAIFDRLKSISGVESGFAKGDNSGDAGHAESVKISYDPSKISCGQLLEIFFAVAHDPTELNRQGPDVGAEYRSVIFYSKDDRSMSPEAYIEQLNKAGVYPRPIVTAVAPLAKFQAVDESQSRTTYQNWST